MRVNIEKIQKITDPYDIWVVDNLFDESVIDSINQSWSQIDDDKWHRGYDSINGKKNLLENGMRSISDIEKMPTYLSQFVTYLHSDEFTNVISNITGISNLISDKTMRWSGLRVMEPNSSQLIHSDARKHPNNTLTKELTCLLYLNKNYIKSENEGCLEIWDDDMLTRTHEIEPLENRLVIFVNSDTSYHGVPKVLSERRAITFSVMSNNTSTNRTKALFVARPEDPEEINNLGLERSKISDNK